MKIKRLLTALLALVFTLCIFSACGKEAKVEELRIPKKIVLTYYHYDEDGTVRTSDQVTTYRFKNGVLTISGQDAYEIEIDENGRETKYISDIRGDGASHSISHYEYAYDGNGNISKTTIYDGNGSVTGRIEYEYDENGKETKYTFYDANGNVTECAEHEYDGNGNRTKTSSSSGWRTEYEFDASGNLKKEIRYDADGNLSGYTGYEYDGNGNQTKEITYEPNGSVSWRTEYEYDGNGNQTKMTHYSGGSILASAYAEYTYDEAGNRTGYAHYSYDRGEWKRNRSFRYEYDGDGTLTKCTRYYGGDGSIYYSMEITEYQSVQLTQAQADYIREYCRSKLYQEY